jgi:hypothetical protein
MPRRTGRYIEGIGTGLHGTFICWISHSSASTDLRKGRPLLCFPVPVLVIRRLG